MIKRKGSRNKVLKILKNQIKYGPEENKAKKKKSRDQNKKANIIIFFLSDFKKDNQHVFLDNKIFIQKKKNLRFYWMQNSLADLVSNLIHDEKLKKLIDSLKKLCAESIGMQPTQINHHPQYIKICQELKEIQFDFVFNQSIKLKELPGIYAMKIEKNKFFTLAFLMMSENSVIGWHSHPKMNAISKCLFGEIQVQVLDKTKLERLSPEDIRYQYPKQYLKKKILSPKEKALALIDECTYNIHQITCHKQAGVLDLLMPEYPDQQCQYYKQVSMKDEKDQEVLMFQQLDEPVEKISGFGKLCQAIIPKEENQTTVSVSQE